MKSVLMYIVSFIVILAIMTFVVAKYQMDNASLAGSDSTLVADSLQADSVQVDSTELKIRSASSTIQQQRRQIDSLQAILTDVLREKQQLSEKIGKTEAARKQQVQLEFEKRTKEMAKIYENMSPEEAAAILANLEESLAVSILGKMKKRKAAQVMQAFDPHKAIALSEYMARSTP